MLNNEISESSLVTSEKSSAPQKKRRLAFLYPGSHGFWPGMGQELYEAEPVFRQTIERVAKVVADRYPLIDYFEKRNEDLVVSSNILLSHILQLAIQLALTELWRSKGVVPDATIGCSLGEMTSCYINETLSIEEIVRLLMESEDLPNEYHDTASFKLVNVSCGLDQFQKLERQFTYDVGLCVEQGSEEIVLYIDEQDVSAFSTFLEKQSLNYSVYEGEYAYHSPMKKIYQEIMSRKMSWLKSSSFRYDHYSSFGGKLIPKGVLLDSNYWYWLYSSPASFHRALEEALHDGFDTILFVGSNEFLGSHVKETVKNREEEILVLDSLCQKVSERKVFNQTLKTIEELGLSKSESAAVVTGNSGSVLNSQDSFVDPASLNLLSPSFIKNPFPIFEELRSRSSVHFLENENCWMILDYDDIDSVLKNPQVYSSKLDYGIDSVMACNDPPDHTRARKALQPYFSAANIESLKNEIERISDELLDRMMLNDQFDIVKEYSVPLTEKVISSIIGFSDEELNILQEIVEPSRYQFHYMEELNQFLEEFLKKTERLPENCLTASLLRENIFSNQEMLSLLRLLWVAGTTTTNSLINFSINTLTRHHAVYLDLKRNRSLLPPFIEEVLRFEGILHNVVRISKEASELGGVNIPAGAKLRLFLAAANRDPKKFDRADLFDLRRNPKEHLSFGTGAHHCLGAVLARLETQIALEGFLSKMPIFETVSAEDQESYIISDHFRGLERLRVRPSSLQFGKIQNIAN